MNKTIIGAIFTICGTLLFSAVLITGAILSIDSASLWYNLFSTSEWGLTFLFYFSIVLFLFGVTCLFADRINHTIKIEN